MKGHVCAILLLMCTRLAYSTTEENDYCPFGSGRMKLNTYMTSYPCMLVRCNPNGRLSFMSCPSSICADWEYTIRIPPTNKYDEYPYCCPETVCRSHKSLDSIMLNNTYYEILKE